MDGFLCINLFISNRINPFQFVTVLFVLVYGCMICDPVEVL